MLRALGQKAIQQHLVEPLRTSNGIGNALHRILIEIEAGSAEGEIEVGDDHARLEQLRHAPGHVVTDRARSDAALGADKREDVADRIRLGIIVEIGDTLHELEWRYRRDQVLADTALQQLAIEHHVIDMADGHHLGACVAAPSQAVELGQHFTPRQRRFDDDQVRRRAGLDSARPQLQPHPCGC